MSKKIGSMGMIKAYKGVSMDAKMAETTLKIISTAMQQIFNKNASSLSFEELYR